MWVPTAVEDKNHYAYALGRFVQLVNTLRIGDRMLGGLSYPLHFSGTPRNVMFNPLTYRVQNFDLGYLFAGGNFHDPIELPEGLEPFHAEFTQGRTDASEEIQRIVSQKERFFADVTSAFEEGVRCGGIYLRPSRSRPYKVSTLREILESSSESEDALTPNRITQHL